MPILRNFTSLPITSLTLLNVQPHRASSLQSWSQSFGYLDRIQVLRLASSSKLKELVIHWDEVTARYFGGVRDNPRNTADRASNVPIIITEGTTDDLTCITTNDPSGIPFTPPRGLTSLTLYMDRLWGGLPDSTDHPASRLSVFFLDSSSLFGSFLKKFEDGLGLVHDQDKPLGLRHLQVITNPFNPESVVAWQLLKEKLGHCASQGDLDPINTIQLGNLAEVRQLDIQLRPSILFPLHPMIALPHLKTYMGPLHTILNIIRRGIADRDEGMGSFAQNLERLVVWDELWYLKDLLTDSPNKLGEPKILHILGLANPWSGDVGMGNQLLSSAPLTVLKIPIMEWSDEVMFAISEQLGALRVLEICYSKGEIPEYALLSMGSRFLFKLQHLHTLRLWNPTAAWRSTVHPETDPSMSSIAGCTIRYSEPRDAVDEDLTPQEEDGPMELQCLSAWKRSIPALCQFQLYSGIVWRRAELGGKWTKREVVRRGLDLDLEIPVSENESNMGEWITLALLG
ncbi:hypothetical protein BDN72DRAFT_963424 [Pluteus cervinus]|uniref:Uncharacterized protein n=1 Tax=Pluteus cervinus TaxID=181527 RepID=A0ACD3AEE5_9AGAR|nr:hypothetical protein BDN72DRAFT_963424 [Pluteus cervinus]